MFNETTFRKMLLPSLRNANDKRHFKRYFQRKWYFTENTRMKVVEF